MVECLPSSYSPIISNLNAIIGCIPEIDVMVRVYCGSTVNDYGRRFLDTVCREMGVCACWKYVL